MQKTIFRFVLLLAVLLLSVSAIAEEMYRPFVLGSSGAGSVKEAAAKAKSDLEGKGFEIVGEYAPYAGAYVLAVTNDSLKKGAAMSEFGGYGVVQRVSITEVDGKIQVSYTNPEWMANMYRMSIDLADVSVALASALGKVEDFGVESARNGASLKKYHYMMMMPYFDDQIKLEDFDSHQAALSAVDAGLAKGKAGVSKVFRVAVPGKDEVLYGVAISQGDGGDKKVMEITDTNPLRHTAHLPYEMLVSGDTVYMLHGKFRIAQSFPDLSMGTFMRISGAPDGIEAVLKEVAED